MLPWRQAERDLVHGRAFLAAVPDAHFRQFDVHEPILDEYNSHLRWCRSSAAGGGARPIPSMSFARLQDFLLLGLAALIVLPVAAVVGSWFQWDAQSAGILREMAATVLPGYALHQRCGLCLAVGAGVAVLGMACGGRGHPVRLPRPPRLRMGACCCRWRCRSTCWPTRTPISCSSADRCRPGCGPPSGWKAACAPRSAPVTGATVAVRASRCTPTSTC